MSTHVEVVAPRSEDEVPISSKGTKRCLLKRSSAISRDLPAFVLDHTDLECACVTVRPLPFGNVRPIRPFLPRQHSERQLIPDCINRRAVPKHVGSEERTIRREGNARKVWTCRAGRS